MRNTTSSTRYEKPANFTPAAGYSYWSFCAGRGYRAHKTLGSAERAAKRDARSIRRIAGGGADPLHNWGKIDGDALVQA